MTDNETRGLGLAPATAGDYRELARRRLPRQLFDFLDGAAYDELTAGENRRAFQRLRLRQRVMCAGPRTPPPCRAWRPR